MRSLAASSASAERDEPVNGGDRPTRFTFDRPVRRHGSTPTIRQTVGVVYARIVSLVALLAAVGTGCGVVSSSESDAASRPESTVAFGTLPDLDELPAIEVDGGASLLESGADELAPGVVTVVGSPETIAIVGDSLTQAAEPEIMEAFGDVEPHVEGLANRRMVSRSPGVSSGEEVVEEILETGEPDLWIVALGTNDVGAGESPEDFEANVEAIVDEIPDDAPLIWVDVWIRDRPAEVIAANAIIRDVLADRPDTAVVNWYQYGDDDGVIVGDGVHLTDAGRTRFADAMADAVDRMFPT